MSRFSHNILKMHSKPYYKAIRQNSQPKKIRMKAFTSCDIIKKMRGEDGT